MFQIGYEIEFLSTKNAEAVRQSLLKAGFMMPELGSGRGGYINWYLTTDRSIRDTSGLQRVTQGLELISPVMGVSKGLRALRRLFKFLDDNGFETNETTGFHIGISYQHKETTLHVDRGLLLMHMDEKRWLDLWDRNDNQYCKSQMKAISESIVQNYRGRKIDESFDWNEISGHVITGDKYQTVNFSKLGKKSPYFEFRIMGGKNYHKRYRDILKTTKAFLRSVKLASKSLRSFQYPDEKAINAMIAEVDAARIRMGLRVPKKKKDQLVRPPQPMYVMDNDAELFDRYEDVDQ